FLPAIEGRNALCEAYYQRNWSCTGATMADLGDSRLQDDGRARGIGRAGAIVGELADAVGSALLEVAEEQGGIAADRVAAIAEAVRCAARSCDQSGSPA